jgi:hypothetical protein
VIKKAEVKLLRMPAPVRGLFADRYDIHRQLLAFEDGPTAFQLDANDPLAARVILHPRRQSHSEAARRGTTAAPRLARDRRPGAGSRHPRR